MIKWQGVTIAIGENATIDADVILGYPAARAITDSALRIGNSAVLRSGTVIYCGVSIGNGLQTGHNVIVREENILGDDVNIWTNSVVDYQCVIGDRVKIHTNVYVAQNSVLEDDVFLAPGVAFANDKYPLSDFLEGPIIRQGAKIGVNVTLLPGVEVGKNAMIGAGSVVTKDIGENMVARGNPAVVVGDVEEVNQKRAKHRPSK